MNEHTWHVNPDHRAIIQDAEGALVASVYYAGAKTVEECDVVIRKHGPLIAASPALLDALTDCLKTLRRIHDEHRPYCYGGCDCTAVFAKSDAAIAQAEGGAS